MKPADLIWMNGEFVPWEDAKVHVLTHGAALRHRRLRGRPLLRHRDRAGGLPPPRPHRPAVQVGRALLHADPVRPRAAAPGDARADRPQRAALLLHPPARLPRLRHDGPVPARRAGRRRRSPSGSGAPTSARRARRNGIRAKVSSWRRISPDSLIPHAKASGPVPQLDPRQDRVAQGRLRGGDPARRQRARLRGLGREHLRRARRRDLTPPQTASILDGINRKSIIQIARDLGFEVVERDIARAELYLADEVFMTGTAAELVAGARDRRPRGRRRPRRARSRARSRAAFEDALHGRTERYREWLDPVPRRASPAPQVA